MTNIVVSLLFVASVLCHGCLCQQDSATNDRNAATAAINPATIVLCGTLSSLILVGTLMDGITRSSETPAVWQNFLTAFSLFKTLPALLSTKTVPDTVPCLNGIRVLSSAWIIMQHIWMWAVLTERTEGFVFQAVMNDLFSVDSFFFLSGLLTAYVNFQEMEEKSGSFPWLYYYAHRYLRLTPAYFVVILFIWLQENSSVYVTSCSRYWWTNILYISNFHPWNMEKSCTPWTWYLSCDMQFHVIAPLLVLTMHFNLLVGLTVILGILILGLFITAYLVILFGLKSSTYAGVSFLLSDPTMDLIYTKPWSRISPYIVGFLLGYVLYRKVKLSLSNEKTVAFFASLWTAVGLILLSCVFGLFFKLDIEETAKHVIYTAFSRFMWASALALIVFACHNGYGGYVNSFLSMQLWIPLSRMTFCVFLVHPIVLTVLYGDFQTSSFDHTSILVNVSAVMLSYAVAIALCLSVEMPCGKIETIMFRQLEIRGHKHHK